MAELLDCLFSRDLERLKILLQKSGGVNTVIPGTEGCTPLHILAGTETINVTDKSCVLSYLLENGADPNARSFENLTPVHIAAMWNNCLELEKLLQNGGDPWLTDSENKNSFDMAANNSSYEAYQLLNIYLAEDKLNFRYKRNPDTDNAKSSDFQFLESPFCIKNENFEDTKYTQCSFNNTFKTANENFPLIFSSDESEDHVLNISKFLKRKHLTKNSSIFTAKESLSDTSPAERDETTNKACAKSSNNESRDLQKAYTKNLNEAYLLSACETEATETTSSNLNSSNNDSYETIVDMDDKSGVVLIEVKSDSSMQSSTMSVDSGITDWKSFQNLNISCHDKTDCLSHLDSTNVALAELYKYSNSKIFDELKNLGDNPGPVLDHTRQIYLNRLARLKSGCEIICDLPKPKYCPEIYLFLENKLDITMAGILEQNMAGEFEQESDKKWREGNQRCCFNYFLLDPRVTQNLPQRAINLPKEQTFLTFLDALFYVGKGTRGRPYNHFFEAAKAMAPDSPKSDKINHILDIWEAGLGVISLHCFHSSIPVEAYTREACIIESVGLENLTNVKKGDYYGMCAKLTTSRKRLIGISLLERALKIFLVEGERCIKPKDIKK